MHTFTKETAIQAGKLSGQARRERNSLAARFPFTDDPYVQRRLARVRKQIDMLSDLMEAETNPQAIDRYSAAIDRLSKLECYLANRPGPGNRKPAPERSSKPSRRDLGATELAPQPLPVVAEQPRPSNPDEPNG